MSLRRPAALFRPSPATPLAAQATLSPVHSVHPGNFIGEPTVFNVFAYDGRLAIVGQSATLYTSPLYTPGTALSFSGTALPENVRFGGNFLTAGYAAPVPGTGNIVIASSGSAQTTRLFTCIPGGPPALAGITSTPSGALVNGLAVDATGRTFLALGRGSVYQYSGSVASPALTFGVDVHGLAVGRDGLVYVASGTNTLTKYRADGTAVDSFALTGFSNSSTPTQPTGLVVGPSGRIYIASGRGLREYGAEGDLIASSNVGNSCAGPVRNATPSLVLDERGYLYFLDMDGCLHVYKTSAGPEPAPWGALALSVWRRRRRAAG